jgi:hypothetical protein
VRRTVQALAILGSVIAILAVTAIRAQPGSFRSQYGRRISPHESTGAMVDGAQLTIVYGRPSMRGRMIFGSLVPYDRVWCPGADEATTLESTRQIQIGSLKIPTGPHTIWILPTPSRWTLVISKESSGFHTRYNSRADLGRVELAKRDLGTPIEQLTFLVAPLASGGGTITMTWEKTEVSTSFSVIQ